MQSNIKNNNWENFVKEEMFFFKPILEDLGFNIFPDQPHTKGERGTFKAGKIILLGESIKEGKKVVIKCARFPEGVNEILEEKKARGNLKKVDFAYHEFLDPKEILFINNFNKNTGYIIQITEFIEEEINFLKRDPKNQFEIVYRSFITQEGIHAVTAKHNKIIKSLFNTFNFNIYSKNLNNYKNIILEFLEEFKNENSDCVEFLDILENSQKEFLNNKYRISQYCGFLTHSDFVPHNFRVRKENDVERVYLLDHSAIIIGNKHDGWARLLNFSVLHSPILETWFLEYFKTNRSVEEGESLRLMRIYRLFELVAHYATIYKNTDGEINKNLKELSRLRVIFWLNLLKAIYENKELDKEIIEDYKKTRDELRSQEELERQKVLY